MPGLFPLGLAPASVALGEHPVYEVEWTAASDRLYVGQNGPLHWTLTREDGADIDSPAAAAVTITDSAGDEVASVAADVSNETTAIILAQLVAIEETGSYRARLEVTMSDGTIIVIVTPIYVM